MSSVTDKRIKMIHEILKGIKIIKFYAYEPEFVKNVSSVRQEELGFVRKLSYLKGNAMSLPIMILLEINTALFTSVPILMSLLVFLAYSLFDSLNPAITFTALSIFTSLRASVRFLPSAINTIAEARIALKRAQDFLLAEDVQIETNSEKLSPDTAIQLERATFQWRKDVEIGKIQEISLSIKKSNICAIIGPTGP
jgi:ABC-type multidrug transport system fused ATPase/permease subunit